MIETLIVVLILIIILPFIVAAVPCFRGYLLYFKAARRQLMLQAIQKIRSKPTFTRLDDISIELKYAFLISEDRFFFSHPGYRIKGIYKAFLLNLRERKIVTGASTISQQLAKNMFFSFDRTYTRKAAEIFAVRKLERMLSKDEILELYCNCIEYGHDTYSIAEAAEKYFDTLPKNLTLGQSIQLASVLPAPSKYDLLGGNELFRMSCYRIAEQFVACIRPEDQEYFMSHYDVKDEAREVYAAIFQQEYDEKKTQGAVFGKIFEKIV